MPAARHSAIAAGTVGLRPEPIPAVVLHAALHWNPASGSIHRDGPEVHIPQIIDRDPFTASHAGQ